LTAPGGNVGARVAPSFPTNEHGQSYGSALYVNSPADEPDLIRAAATNGREGYVKKVELDEASGANVANPEEAVAYQKRMDEAAARGETFHVNVYESDGVTVIGEFLIQP